MNVEIRKLGSFSEMKYGKMPQKNRVKDRGLYPIYSGYRITGYYDEYNIEKPTLIVVARGVGGTGDVKISPKKCYLTNLSISVDVNEEIALKEYLFYYFQIHNLRYLDSGSAQSQITISDLGNVEVPLPCIETQKKIVEILKCFDLKIKNNDKINRNLQEQADAIYANMFVKTKDVKGRYGRLDELITVKYGKDHKKLVDGLIPVYGSGGIMRYVEHPLYTEESVLIPRKGSLNNVMYVNEPFWSVDTMFYTEMKISNVAKFVYHFMKGKDLASMNAGSAVPSMTTDILNAMELMIPSEEKLYEFEQMVNPLYVMMKANTVENTKLANLRDNLLPRLMSGELDVSDLEI